MWRRAADYAERAVGGRIEPFVQRRDFAIGLSIAKKTDLRVRRLVAAQTSRVLHTLNMPTRADIRRVHEHLEALDAHLSEVVREHGGGQDSEQPAGDGRDDGSRAEQSPGRPPHA
jgi:hypothetical protein